MLKCANIQFCWPIQSGERLLVALSRSITHCTSDYTSNRSRDGALFDGEIQWTAALEVWHLTKLSTNQYPTWSCMRYLMLFLFVAWSMPTNFARFPVSHSTFPCRRPFVAIAFKSFSGWCAEMPQLETQAASVFILKLSMNQCLTSRKQSLYNLEHLLH